MVSSFRSYGSPSFFQFFNHRKFVDVICTVRLIYFYTVFYAMFFEKFYLLAYKITFFLYFKNKRRQISSIHC